MHGSRKPFKRGFAQPLTGRVSSVGDGTRRADPCAHRMAGQFRPDGRFGGGAAAAACSLARIARAEVASARLPEPRLPVRGNGHWLPATVSACTPLAFSLPLMRVGIGHRLLMPPAMAGTVAVVPALAGVAAARAGVSQQLTGVFGAYLLGALTHHGSVQLGLLMLASNLSVCAGGPDRVVPALSGAYSGKPIRRANCPDPGSSWSRQWSFRSPGSAPQTPVS